MKRSLYGLLLALFVSASAAMGAVDYTGGLSADEMVGHPVHFIVRSVNGAPLDYTHLEINKGDGSPVVTIPVSETVRTEVGAGFADKATTPISYTQETPPGVEFVGTIKVMSDTLQITEVGFSLRQDPEPAPSGNLNCDSSGCEVPAPEGFAALMSSTPQVTNWTANGKTVSLQDSMFMQTTRYNPNGKLAPGTIIKTFVKESSTRKYTLIGQVQYTVHLPAIYR